MVLSHSTRLTSPESRSCSGSSMCPAFDVISLLMATFGVWVPALSGQCRRKVMCIHTNMWTADFVSTSSCPSAVHCRHLAEGAAETPGRLNAVTIDTVIVD